MLLLLWLACAETAPPADPAIATLRANPLVATRHGTCRMECRHLDLSEVQHVLANGKLDPARTRDDGECPSYALEGTTPDDQRARIVLAACPAETRIVTVIDLDTDWPCACD